VFAELCGFRLTDNANGVDGADRPQVDLALVATQGEGDEPALWQALTSPARHVLLIASRRKAERLREAMRAKGVGEERLVAIEAPAGPDIGAHNPAHIALAAVAGAVAHWQGATTQIAARLSDPVGTGMAVTPRVTDSAAAKSGQPTRYVNPVCGITVEPAEAKYTLDFEGQAFYFCCDGCKIEFERDPAKYAAIQAMSPVNLGEH
jgi:xanthine dehydrogenase accessory factor